MLSDYCNIFAEKTNRIGRNVESFVQSRALFARRSTDDHHPCSSTSSFSLSRANAAVHRRSCNGDAVNYSRFFNPAEEDEDHDHPRRSRRLERSVVRSRRDDVYPSGEGGMEMQQRRVDYGGWREEAAGVSSDLNARCKGRRICSSTLPRRSRTINFRDQPIQGPLSQSRLTYPRRSLQDISDLDELDEGRGDVAGSLAEGGGWRRGDVPVLDEDVGWHRRRGYSSREERLEDDYLRLYRSLSRLSKYPQGGKYEPGQVHYERECRTFGKDTVAFIYYKTCYL